MAVAAQRCGCLFKNNGVEVMCAVIGEQHKTLVDARNVEDRGQRWVQHVRSHQPGSYASHVTDPMK